jgi:hypothetical protein
MFLKQGLYRGIAQDDDDSEKIKQDQTVYNDGTEIYACPSGYTFDVDTKKCMQ